MKKKVYTTIGITSILLFMCCFIGFITMDDPGQDFPGNIVDFSVTGSYQINPQTLLQSLECGDTSVFQVESGIPEDPQLIMPVEWTQAEFLMVAEALFQFVWKEPLDSWNLYRMNFVTICKDDPKGFNHLDLFFYQEAVGKGYSVRTLRLYPDYGYVAWGGDTHYRGPLFGWKIINLTQMKVSADEALNIMETKGGKDFRISVKNNCRIFVDLNPENYNRYAWDVDYYSYDTNIYPGPRLWIPIK